MQLHVKVESVLYPKPDTEGSWYILRVRAESASLVAKGEMGWRPDENERLILDGDWGVYKGQKEFKFKTAMHDIPISAQDQLRYVCERTNGVGMAMETAIWERWGENWMTDLKPGAIRRLNGRLYEDLRQSIETFQLEKEKSEAIAWLMGKGATLGMAQKAWERWEKGTIGIVQKNCYQLADLPHQGFGNVDNSIRFAFEIQDDDPRRIKAAIVYAMGQLTDQGSTVISWYHLFDHVSKLLKGMYSSLIASCVAEMFEEGTLRPFESSHSLCLGRDFEHETRIWDFITDGKFGGAA